jgi:hypothetical protein
MNEYRYIHYDNGGIVLHARDFYTRMELNRLTRFLFGEGAAANQVFNCGVGAFIKFQNKPDINKSRVFLTTKVWRYCKKNKIEISHKNFPPRKIDGNAESNFEYFINYINEYLEIHKIR